MNTQPTRVRRRTVAWEDASRTAAGAETMSGLDFLRAVRDGALPPAPALLLLGIGMGELEQGRVTMRLDPGEHLYNPLGTVHGGMLSTLLDSAMGCAVQSTLPLGRAYTTLELKVNFLRAVREATGTVTAEGRVVHGGRQTALAEARLTDAGGKLYATASSTCLLFAAAGAGA